MFNSIAPRYDLLNRLLSLRQDVYWRKKMISALALPDNGKVLDMACGTGDVMLEIYRQKGRGLTIIGSDFSPAMLQLARQKTSGRAIADTAALIAGNALHMPFKPTCFDAVTIAFGIRNIADKKSALTAFYNGLKKGGRLAVLELTTPPKGLFLSLYLFYFKRILPIIGWLVSGNPQAYHYLPESVLHFPESKDFAGMMKAAGFRNIRWRRLTIGIVTLYLGEKP
jgi:demethylmenaquinone methyltransferase/2-methoxy-6-polyprenyl-1,4-benzoquinol methylase